MGQGGIEEEKENQEWKVILDHTGMLWTPLACGLNNLEKGHSFEGTNCQTNLKKKKKQ